MLMESGIRCVTTLILSDNASHDTLTAIVICGRKNIWSLDKFRDLNLEEARW